MANPHAQFVRRPQERTKRAAQAASGIKPHPPVWVGILLKMLRHEGQNLRGFLW
jgi:hypothetical protein